MPTQDPIPRQRGSPREPRLRMHRQSPLPMRPQTAEIPRCSQLPPPQVDREPLLMCSPFSVLRQCQISASNRMIGIGTPSIHRRIPRPILFSLENRGCDLMPCHPVAAGRECLHGAAGGVLLRYGKVASVPAPCADPAEPLHLRGFAVLADPPALAVPARDGPFHSAASRCPSWYLL
jgi:hypothetical protein